VLVMTGTSLLLPLSPLPPLPKKWDDRTDGVLEALR